MQGNTVRGEVSLEIDGKPHCLCLTLGALAEIESALGLSGFSELGERLGKISANDVLVILAALLAGGKNAMSRDQLCRAKLDPGQVAEAIASVFTHASAAK